MRRSGRGFPRGLDAGTVRLSGIEARRSPVEPFEPAVGDALTSAIARYEPIIHASPMGVAILDLAGRYRRANRVACALLGRSEDELRALRWQDVTHPEDLGTGEDFTARVAAGDDRPFQVTRRYLRPDGSVLPVLLSVTVLREGGQPIGYLSIFADLTEQKRIEREKRREASMVQVLKEVAVAANEAATVDEALGRTIELLCAHTGWPVGHAFMVSGSALQPTGIWHVEDPEAFRAFVEVTGSMRFEIGQGLPGRAWLERRAVWVSDAASDPGFLRGRVAENLGVRAGFAFPVVAGEEVAGVLEFFARDRLDPDDALLDLASNVGTQLGRVVERERAAEAIANALAREQDAVERLRALDEWKNTFLSAVSHDLRSPIATIMGFASIVREHDERLSSGERATYLDHIVRGAEKLDRMLSDLLDVERIRGGVVEVMREPVPVADLLGHVLGGMPEASERVELDAEPIIAMVEGAKVERIVENLVSNALKYTPPDARIWVRAHRRGDDVELSVEDEGPGVPEQLRESLFDPFTRVPGSPIRGTGLGLALVARFAELHGGGARVEDREGGGARFVVTFPDAIAPDQTRSA